MRRSAARCASRGSSAVPAALGQLAQFSPKFTVIVEARGVEFPLFDGRPHGAARFLEMAAVGEAAGAGEGLDIIEGRFDALVDLP